MWRNIGKIDGERRVFQVKWTNQYFFIAHKRNSCVMGLVCSETSLSIPSDVDRLAKDMECQTSHWLRISHRMLPLINLTSSSLLDKVNAAGAQRLLKLNVKKTKLMTIGDVPDDIRWHYHASQQRPSWKVKQFKYQLVLLNQRMVTAPKTWMPASPWRKEECVN